MRKLEWELTAVRHDLDEALRRSPERMDVLMDAMNDGALAQAETERDEALAKVEGLAAALREIAGCEQCDTCLEDARAALAKHGGET